MDIHPSNWKTVQLFFASASQWNMSFGGATGLNYPSIESIARAMNIKWNAKRIAQLNVIEREALAELKKANK